MTTTSRVSQVQATLDARQAKRTRNAVRTLVLLSIVILGVIAGHFLTMAQVSQNTTLSGTIPACSVYQFTAQPDLHGARADVCYTDNGDGSWTLSTSAFNHTLGGK